MLALKSIRTILLADSDISTAVSTRVYAMNLPQEKDMPAIVLSVISIRPSPTKTTASLVDFVRIQVDSVSPDFSEAVDIDEYVRTAIDRITWGTVHGVSVQGIQYDGGVPFFDFEREIYTVSSDFVVRVLRDSAFASVPVNNLFYASDTLALADGLISGQVYYLADDNIYGVPGGLLKKITE